jgi:(2R)-sulfolactate sulfo-lyase subunit alpha
LTTALVNAQKRLRLDDETINQSALIVLVLSYCESKIEIGIMKHGILLHEPQDDVGVAVLDLKKGSTIGAMTLEGKQAGKVKLLNNVPLGHKVALRDLPKDKPVLKYGRPVGKAVQNIARGAHVHTHNVKTLRWAI